MMVDITGKGVCPLCNRDGILIDYKYKKMCIDCYTEEILKEISLTIVNQTPSSIELAIILGSDTAKIKHYAIKNTAVISIQNHSIIHFHKLDEKSWEERKKKFPDFIEGYEGSEEICKCGMGVGTGKDCSYCKQFAESKTLGEHKK